MLPLVGSLLTPVLVFFFPLAVSLQIPLLGKLGMTVSISGSWPSFHSHGFTCSVPSSSFHAVSEGCNSVTAGRQLTFTAWPRASAGQLYTGVMPRELRS